MNQSRLREFFQKDFLTVMKEIRKFNNKKNQNNEHRLKIALLGAGSLQYFKTILEYALKLEDIDSEIFIGTYNGIDLDILDDQSSYNLFQPQITIIFTSYHHIRKYPEMFLSEEEINRYIGEEIGRYEVLWNKINKKNGSKIFQTNFVIPMERQLGNLESNYLWSRQSFLELLNLELKKRRPKFVSILDFEYLASMKGKKVWFDFSNYYLNKSNMSYQCLLSAVEEVTLNILNFQGCIKKCLVLDLDNTLWGGILEEVGVQQVNLFSTDPLGEAFLAFQTYVKRLKERGVILAICSKNDENYAKQVFLKNNNMVLKLEDISCFVANWQNKADNIRMIASTLNIGLDSIVFVDDNPVERDMVKTILPEVEVLELSEDPANYIMDLENAKYFEWIQITREDQERTVSYKIKETLLLQEDHFNNLDSYLESLEMVGEISTIDEETIERAAQLLNKTNQFNNIRYRGTEAQLLSLKEEGCILLGCTLKDKFSNYGLISVAILKIHNGVCTVQVWAMSCRVFKRSVEEFMLNHFFHLAFQNQCSQLRVNYIANERNNMIGELLRKHGFSQCQEDKQQYKLAITEDIYFENKIKRK